MGNRTCDRAQVSPLLDALHDDAESVRMAAFQAIVRLPLTKEAWLEVAEVASQLLRPPTPPREMIGSAAFVPIRSVRLRLRALLKAEEPSTRMAAAHALARARDQSALEPLLGALGCGAPRWWQWDALRARLENTFSFLPARAGGEGPDERQYVRMEAAHSLTLLDVGEAESAVRFASSVDRCAEVRLFAGVALARTGDPDPLIDAFKALAAGRTLSVGGDPVERSELLGSVGPIPEKAAQRLREAAQGLGDFEQGIAFDILRATAPPGRVDAPAAETSAGERLKAGKGGVGKSARRRAAELAAEFGESPPLARADWNEKEQEFLQTLSALEANDATRLVTRLFELAGRPGGAFAGIRLGNWIMCLVAALREPFRPDVGGLFRATRGAPHHVALQAAWAISRADLAEVIAELGKPLKESPAAAERRHAAWLIEKAVRYRPHEHGPLFGGGAEPGDATPVAELIDDTPGGEHTPAPREHAATDVTFTVRHPKEVRPQVWHTLLAYAHLPEAIEAVQADAAARLGERFGGAGEARGQATSTIRRGADITVVPELPGCRCNPRQITFCWLEDWHCAEFRLGLDPEEPGSRPGSVVNGSVAYYVGPLLVGEVPIWASITREAREAPAPRELEQASRDPYLAVFPSYSHQDAALVEWFEESYKALGMDFLRDVHALRSGEAWQEAILGKIDEADVFQLFWSRDAKASPHVEREWRHALGRSKPRFIRPVYWQKPMPEPPAALSGLHFAFLERTPGASQLTV